ncbi:MAG: formylmethanofuran dehydrogenase subunit A [Theionarchaea archaeon]|nr:formylmethanofuran dehydrogenase subunit A [Theionarchaea archaeon]MBU7037239.1 formylmethanofuran dehydrogenase subunit A [Theionarchaea archaeon]
MIIKNGTVYDPANNINGEKVDIFIEKGKIVDESELRDKKEIEASGLVVLPGGVEIHTHIAGSKVNIARIMRPEDHRKDVVRKTPYQRSGTGYTVPTTFTIGYRYAEMGYTTVWEAAAPPLGARHSHEELLDIPIVDKGIFTLMGSNYFVLKYTEEGEFEKLKNFVAWLLHATKGYAVKIVNPGGVESWKWGKNVSSLDDTVQNFNVTPREILKNLARAADELHLPHSIHVHCNNLGSPGNYAITRETIEMLSPYRRHITHIQFNSYAGEDWGTFTSGGSDIAATLNKSKNVTCDVGQVIFGDATTMTADGPWQHTLFKLSGNKWANSDVEMETGAGIVPYRFKKKNVVNAIQWSIGLEVLLLTEDPYKVFLTTDHPNAGPFYHYPQVMELLMSRKKREEMLETVHPLVKERSVLPSIEREYSLSDLAVVTRAGTARALGMTAKGHLGVGADADISIYRFDEEQIQKSFQKAAYTIKDGVIVVKDGTVVADHMGKTYVLDVKADLSEEERQIFSKYYTVQVSNYPVEEAYLPQKEVVTCR